MFFKNTLSLEFLHSDVEISNKHNFFENSKKQPLNLKAQIPDGKRNEITHYAPKATNPAFRAALEMNRVLKISET